MLGPQNRPHVPSRTAKSSKKGILRVLRAAQGCQNNVLVVPYDLPRHPLRLLWALSWSLCSTKIRQLDGLLIRNLRREDQNSEKVKFWKSSKILGFSMVSMFFRVLVVARRLLFYVFLCNVNHKLIINANFRKAVTRLLEESITEAKRSPNHSV